ncbi:unnamed protein product [Lactuca saligna]|uniref:Uncharacterized protein n=1 Tax=Lactuca saligna TaxID=75948 RepID=A0AA35YGR6_LACSI|nr:unnamed protein product [Lactuca saligna]
MLDEGPRRSRNDDGVWWWWVTTRWRRLVGFANSHNGSGCCSRFYQRWLVMELSWQLHYLCFLSFQKSSMRERAGRSKVMVRRYFGRVFAGGGSRHREVEEVFEKLSGLRWWWLFPLISSKKGEEHGGVGWCLAACSTETVRNGGGAQPRQTRMVFGGVVVVYGDNRGCEQPRPVLQSPVLSFFKW